MVELVKAKRQINLSCINMQRYFLHYDSIFFQQHEFLLVHRYGVLEKNRCGVF